MSVTPDQKRARTTKPFQPAIGTDFGPVEEVEAKTRDFLARVIALGAVVALAISGAYSLIRGNYIVVLEVWSIVGPMIGAVVSYYFGPQRDTE